MLMIISGVAIFDGSERSVVNVCFLAAKPPLSVWIYLLINSLSIHRGEYLPDTDQRSHCVNAHCMA